MNCLVILPWTHRAREDFFCFLFTWSCTVLKTNEIWNKYLLDERRDFWQRRGGEKGEGGGEGRRGGGEEERILQNCITNHLLKAFLERQPTGRKGKDEGVWQASWSVQGEGEEWRGVDPRAKLAPGAPETVVPASYFHNTFPSDPILLQIKTILKLKTNSQF